jgi:hypothetical protein
MQQSDEVMRLEEVSLRLLPPQPPAHAMQTDSEQRLELLEIRRATKQVNMERLHNLVGAEEEFQRGCLLKNPPVPRKPRPAPKKLTHAAESEVIRLYDDRTRLYSYSQRELALEFQVCIHPLIVH